MKRIRIALGTGVLLGLFSASAVAQDFRQAIPNGQVFETEEGLIVASDSTGTYVYESLSQYVDSDYFLRNGKRCGAFGLSIGAPEGSTADCSNSFTNPLAEYAPSVQLYRIPVVVHVLRRKNGAGNVSDALIHSQIDILNEDFRALAGTNGAPGTNVEIEFFLATTDPNGNPTTGITRHKNNTWYNDAGTYWNSVGWDTTRYLNIYTNLAGGNLGYAYVPSGGGVVGQPWDGVRILWSTFGRNAPYGPPYNQGRTTTHEVGHYLGLYHTFQGGCASASGCASNGDLICDTNPESSPNYNGCSRVTCSSSDPVKNYMDYSVDLCMDNFTSNQARRMRCTLENWRTDLTATGPSVPGKAGSPSPANASTGVSTGATLGWSAGSGAVSYDVYFGIDPTPDAGEFLGNQAGTSFAPGTLANATTYYWRIDSVNGAGTTGGDVWSFTTQSAGGGIALSVNGYKVKGKWRVDLSWSGASGGNVEIWRDGSLLTTSANDGAYTDVTNFKGGGSLTYQVCEIGGSPCSNSATANF